MLTAQSEAQAKQIEAIETSRGASPNSRLPALGAWEAGEQSRTQPTVCACDDNCGQG